jgi:hypothetical protein
MLADIWGVGTTVLCIMTLVHHESERALSNDRYRMIYDRYTSICSPLHKAQGRQQGSRQQDVPTQTFTRLSINTKLCINDSIASILITDHPLPNTNYFVHISIKTKTFISPHPRRPSTHHIQDALAPVQVRLANQEVYS